MEKQNAIGSLKESIRLLEMRQAEEGKVFREQFQITYESLKPVSLIKSSVKELVSFVEMRAGLLETIVSMLSGYFTQKMVIRSRNPLMKIFMNFLQLGITGVVDKSIESIRNFIAGQINRFFGFVGEKVPQTQEEKVSRTE